MLHFLLAPIDFLQGILSGISGVVSLGIFLLGAILGSFYNVVIYRLPAKTLWDHHRSRCRYCQKIIPFWNNIPCLSWFFLKGKTACCQKPLSLQYPLVEWTTALGLVAIYQWTPFFAEDSWEFSLPQFLRFLHNSLFFSMMLVSSVIDLRLKIIPNVLTYGLILSSPLGCGFIQNSLPSVLF